MSTYTSNMSESTPPGIFNIGLTVSLNGPWKYTNGLWHRRFLHQFLNQTVLCYRFASNSGLETMHQCLRIFYEQYDLLGAGRTSKNTHSEFPETNQQRKKGLIIIDLSWDVPGVICTEKTNVALCVIHAQKLTM